MSKNLCAAYNYDAMENTLYVSNAFRKKASQYGTTEYNIFVFRAIQIMRH